MAVFILWIGAWLWVSGTIQKLSTHTEQAFYDMTAEQGFAVQNIFIEGRENTDIDLLRAIINLEQGDPLLSFSPKEAKSMIDRISWIEDSHVERRFPDTVYISLLERQPVALWQNQGRIRLIDRNGVVLTDTPDKRFKDLMIVVGNEKATHELNSVLSVLEAEPLLASKVDALQYRSNRRWNMTLRNGIVVKLPQEGLPFALALLSSSEQEHQILQKDIMSIDLRDPERLTVRTRPGKTETLKSLITVRSDDKAI